MKKIGLLVALLTICIFWSINQALAQFNYDNQFGDQYGYSQYGDNMPQQFGMRNLIGDTVTNAQGQNLGTVADVIASESGQVTYLIVSRGGFLGLQGQLTPIPWQTADARVRGNRIIIDVSRQEMNNAPSWQYANLPDFSNPQVQDQINSYFSEGRYYGYQPYYGGQYPYGPGQQGYFGPYRSHRIEGEDYQYNQPEYEGNEGGLFGGLFE
jgi:sporulation protein YlmC with PRC-barrel domain